MQIILVISNNPDNIVNYLQQVGYNAQPVYTNDMLERVIEEKGGDVAVYFSPVAPKDDTIALRWLKEAGTRVILVAAPNDSILAYAAALGIHDILGLPLELESIAHAIENPATEYDAAEQMRGIIVPTVKEKKEEEKKEPSSREKQGLIQKYFRCFTERDNSIETIGRSVQIYEGLTVTDNIDLIRKTIKSSKQFYVILDADIKTAKLSNSYGVDSADIWRHDWRLGLSAKPHKISKRLELFTIVPEDGQDADERDIRAMGDIVEAAIKEKKNVLIYLTKGGEIWSMLRDLKNSRRN